MPAEKLVRDAIRVCLLRDDRVKLRNIVEKLVAMAENGDLGAIKEVIDRIDGKAIQGVAGPDNEGPVELVIRWRPPDES